MQVTAAVESDQFALIGGGKARSFQINANAHFFRILSDGLYQRKEEAVVRELICNIFDIHAASGNPDLVGEVTITPTAISFRDFGPGIADEKMEEIYLTYGGSTKQNDDSQIGGFGLGCKSPFAVSDHFTVTSHHAGFRRIYALTVGSDESSGEPTCREMGRPLPTTETGLLVTVPIKPGQEALFKRTVQRFVRRSGLKIKLNGMLVTRTRDYAGIEEAGYGLYDPIEDEHQSEHIWVMYGRVLYPLTEGHDEVNDLVKQLERLRENTGKVFVLWAPPSSLAIKPDRESLGYSEKTLETVKKIGWRAVKDLRNRLPKAQKDLFLGMIKDVRRERIGKVFEKIERRYNYDIDGASVGRDNCASLIAGCTLPKVSKLKLRIIAANYYGGDRKRLINPPKSRWNDLVRGSAQHQLRNIVRAVRPAGDRPALWFRKYGDGSLQRASLMELGYEADAWDLTIAPSRTAALMSPKSGFFLVDRSLTPEQIAEIKQRAAMFRIKTHLVEPTVRPKPDIVVVKQKVELEREKFYGFTLAGGILRRNKVVAQKLAAAKLTDPKAFLPITIELKKEVITPKECKYGPVQPTIERKVPSIDESTLHWFREFADPDVAIPIDTDQRDQLQALGTPRYGEWLIAELRKLVKPKNFEHAFTACCALYDHRNKYNRPYEHREVMAFAGNLITYSRRMACAALMQKYRKSADLDRTYALWKTAEAFFSMNFGPSMWLERGEHAIYQDCAQQYRELLARFDTYQSTETEAFLKRLRADRLTIDDVAHLKFLSRLVVGDFKLKNEMPAEQERYARMIEAEGEVLLGRKRIRQTEKLKLRGPPPKEED